MYKVLLVDDEPIVKIALRTMIDWESLGFSICGTAADGIEALNIVDEHMPDIIITDLKMPNMDGLQLIRELKERKYGGKILVASNFGEYELVREALLLGAVDYLLKISIQTESLIEQLNKTVQLIEEEKQTLQEEATKEDAFISNLQKVKNSLLRDFFTVSEYDLDYLTQNKSIQFEFIERPCCLFYLSLYASHEKSNSNSKISLSFIENLILNLLQIEQDVEIFQVDKNAIVILISSEQLPKHGFDAQSFSHRIQSLIQLYMTVNSVIIYSKDTAGYVSLRQDYLKMKDTMLHYFYDRKSVMEISSQSATHRIKFTNFITISRLMSEFIYNRSKQALEEHFNTYIKQCREHFTHPSSAKALIIKSIEFLPLMDEKLNISNMEQYEGFIKKIEDCRTAEGLFKYTLSVLEEFTLDANSDSNPDTSGVRKEIRQVVNYINENYQDKLTLERIAEYVNFSETYLSRVFREQIGVSLMQYINTVRLNKAAELILQGHNYIKEVANLVGVNDQFYFSRMFKRHFGVAPTDYKQLFDERRSSIEN